MGGAGVEMLGWSALAYEAVHECCRVGSYGLGLGLNIAVSASAI